MSFLGEPFQHDLFVSYSHGAFKGENDSHLKRWSQMFAKELREEFAGTTEFKDISVFLDESKRSDENVDRTEKLTGLLHDRVAGSALFALLMTPQYLRSKWCRQELDWWCERHHPDTFAAGSRISVCRVRPSDEDAWPERVKDVVGYFGYDRNKEPDKARPFTWRGSKRDLDDYNDLLVELSGDMMQRLRALKEILEERRRQEAQARKYVAAEVKTLFLHGRTGTEIAWGEACTCLQAGGFVVLPDGGPLPVDDHGGLNPEHQKQLKRSDGLLLLGAEEGPAIDTDIIVIGRNYRCEAIAQGSLLPGAVVNMVGTKLRTKQRLENVKNLGLDWIDSEVVKHLPERIRSWLVKSSAQLVRAVGGGT